MPENQIRVPKRLHKPHRYVSATRDAAQRLRPGEDLRIKTRARQGGAELAVSKAQLRRSLLILQGLFREAERRGYEVQALRDSYDDPVGVGIVVAGHAYRIKVTEQTSQVALTPKEVERWRRENKWRVQWSNAEPPVTRPVANGKLRLSLPASHGSGRRSNWADGARGSIETKLGSVFRELETRAVEDTRREEAWARKREELEREREEQERQAALVRIDSARAARLAKEAAAWRLASDTRAYVAALRDRLPGLGQEDSARIAVWCDWALDWADRSDPTNNLRLIVGRDHPQDG